MAAAGTAASARRLGTGGHTARGGAGAPRSQRPQRRLRPLRTLGPHPRSDGGGPRPAGLRRLARPWPLARRRRAGGRSRPPGADPRRRAAGGAGDRAGPQHGRGGGDGGADGTTGTAGARTDPGGAGGLGRGTLSPALAPAAGSLRGAAAGSGGERARARPARQRRRRGAAGAGPGSSLPEDHAPRHPRGRGAADGSGVGGGAAVAGADAGAGGRAGRDRAAGGPGRLRPPARGEGLYAGGVSRRLAPAAARSPAPAGLSRHPRLGGGKTAALRAGRALPWRRSQAPKPSRRRRSLSPAGPNSQSRITSWTARRISSG